MLIQELSRIKAGWDDPVPEDVNIKWRKWFNNIKKVGYFKFDRCVISCQNYDMLELHVFADASTEAYSVVCFCRITYRDKIMVKFLFGKNIVRPVNCDWTVPRMELIAASLA